MGSGSGSLNRIGEGRVGGSGGAESCAECSNVGRSGGVDGSVNGDGHGRDGRCEIGQGEGKRRCPYRSECLVGTLPFLNPLLQHRLLPAVFGYAPACYAMDSRPEASLVLTRSDFLRSTRRVSERAGVGVGVGVEAGLSSSVIEDQVSTGHWSNGDDKMDGTKPQASWRHMQLARPHVIEAMIRVWGSGPESQAQRESGRLEPHADKNGITMGKLMDRVCAVFNDEDVKAVQIWVGWDYSVQHDQDADM